MFAVDVNCQLLRKDTGIPQYGLFLVCTHASPIQCLLNQELRKCMAAMILRGSCVSEVFFRVHEQGTVSACTCRVYNGISMPWIITL